MKLSAAQVDAYARLSAERSMTARDLGVRITTLDRLVKMGLAKRFVVSASSRLVHRDRYRYKKIEL